MSERTEGKTPVPAAAPTQRAPDDQLTPANFLDTAASLPPRPTCAERQAACLVQIYPIGPGLGARFPLGDNPIFIGRERTCEVCLDDPAVSRRHAEIRPAIGGHFLIDLRSTNGTFINDRPATSYRLSDGDYIRVGARIFRYLAGDNVETLYHEEIYRLTIVDGLTGVYNKRYLLEYLDREIARTARHHRPLALVMFDIDHFKAINDKLGHLGGDYTLRELANCVQPFIRKEEVMARYGGEEFALVLPETAREVAAHRAETLRQAVEHHSFSHGGNDFKITISLGVAVSAGEEPLTFVELIRRADEKLYQAKHAGRNCLMV
jgi:diguanylate cyclase (GGDEF)-like protein